MCFHPTAGPIQTNFSKPTVSVILGSGVTSASAISLQITPALGDAISALGYSIQGSFTMTSNNIPTNLTIPVTAAGINLAGTALQAVVNGLQPNAQISNIQIQLGSGSSPTNWSPVANAITVSPTLTSAGYTLPVAPNAPTTITANSTANSLTFDLLTNTVVPPGNPANTVYHLEISPDPANFAAAGSQSVPFTPSDSTVVVNNLQSGAAYSVRSKRLTS